MNECPDCHQKYSAIHGYCPYCAEDRQLSDPDAKLDDMIEKAAVPTLATLFRKAKASGAIKPITGYGGTPASS
jgi:hypothetical protein